jgi:hypothetical protein
MGPITVKVKGAKNLESHERWTSRLGSGQPDHQRVPADPQRFFRQGQGYAVKEEGSMG